MNYFKFPGKLIFACASLVYIACTWKSVDGIEIECIPLKSCPTALQLVHRAKHAPETTEFLKISHCGVDKKNQPKVWCSLLNFCVTPQNRNGTCTPLKKCKSFLKLRNTLDTSDPEVDQFLNTFRCNEILEEPHVCCQNEPFETKTEDIGLRSTPTHSNFNHKPPTPGRFSYNDYDYDWNSGGPSEYSNHHDYYDSFQPNYNKKEWDIQGSPLDYSNSNKDNRWNIRRTTEPSYSSRGYMIPNRVPNYRGNNDKVDHYHKDPDYFSGYDYSNNREVPDNSNTRGTSKKDNTTPKSREATYTTEITNHRPTTSTNRNKEGSRSVHEQKRRRDNTRSIQTQKNKSNSEGTTPSTKRTTPSNDRTTTKRIDSNFNIGEGDIIFEDSFEDLKGRSRSTTEVTTKSSSRRRSSQDESRKSCETPDSKPGICLRQNNCERYKILQNNLDRSQKSVRDYLDRFKCNSNEEICCQSDEENAIDNSVFNVDRSNENIPEPLSKICGRQTANTDRIVGGRVADLGEFPWLALLQYPSNKGIQSGCGGSLINARYVVTAAHCVDEQILRNRGLGQVRQVVLGEYDTRNKTDCIYMSIGQDCADPAKYYRVELVTPHRMYSSSTTQHDIALLRLDKDVTFTDYIKPICLPTKATTLRGNETFTIAGWGRTTTEMFSPMLRKAKIPSVKKENCNKRGRSLIEGQICAGLGNGTDSCNGDSGGPLMLQVNSNFEFVSNLMGVISYGFFGCGQGPSINTYVPYYLDWINENMKL